MLSSAKPFLGLWRAATEQGDRERQIHRLYRALSAWAERIQRTFAMAVEEKAFLWLAN